MERKLVPGMLMRHFKGNLYQIITIASHSETMEDYVVYQALYGEYKTFVRPYDMFMSEVDHEKYKDAKQKYRFECVTLSKEKPKKEEQEAVKENDKGADVSVGKQEKIEADTSTQVFTYTNAQDSLMDFLDARSCKDKIAILDSRKGEWTSQMLNSMAMSLDFVLRSEALEEQMDEIRSCLRTHMRFEDRRREQ